jgi:hypothetical protein
MLLEYRLSFQDYQEANQAHLKSQRWIYLFFWFLIVGGLFLLVMTLLIKRIPDLFSSVLFLSLPLILFNPYFSNPIKDYFLNRFWKKLPNSHHPISLEVNEETLNFKSVTYESSLQWQFFIQAIETKNIFMLYQAKALFNMLPKRAFSSDEQMAEFRELVRTKIAKFQQV